MQLCLATTVPPHSTSLPLKHSNPINTSCLPSQSSSMKLQIPAPRLAKVMNGLKPKTSTPSPRVTPTNAAPPGLKSITSRLRLPHPRPATILSGIKVTATVAGQLGSAAPVPLIQPIADGVKKIVEHCELLDCQNAQEIMQRAQVPRRQVRECSREDIGEDEMDAHLAYSLAELEHELVRIHDIMKGLSNKSFFKCMISTGEHCAAGHQETPCQR
ncbi:hypothetical protein L226DRAFT_617777, partial [Lentinus tigrinus ALCF2SS1-7]